MLDFSLLFSPSIVSILPLDLSRGDGVDHLMVSLVSICVVRRCRLSLVELSKQEKMISKSDITSEPKTLEQKTGNACQGHWPMTHIAISPC